MPVPYHPLNVALLILLFLGTAVVQFFIGGMRPIFAIPGYALIALGGLVSLLQIRKNRPLPSMICLVSSLIFFGYILGRSCTSPVEYLARPDRYMVLACLVVYLCVSLYLTDPKVRMVLLSCLMVLAVGQIAIGAIQFTQGNNFLPFDYTRADYGRRASGFYVCPNHFAGLLEILGAMALALLFWSRAGVKSRMLLLYFAGLALVGIAISGSRGGYLSTGCMLLVLLLLSAGIIRKILPRYFLLITCVSVLALLAAVFAGEILLKKDDLLASRLNSLVDTQNMRRQLWEAAIRQYHLEPSVGTGSGTYLYLGRKYRDPSVNYDPVWVHGDYLHLLAEYGLAGAVTFLIFLGTHLWNGISAMRSLIKKRLLEANLRTSNALALVVGALSAIAAIMAHSFVDFNVHIPGNALVLAVLFGCLANPPVLRPPSHVPPDWRLLPGRLIIPLLAVWLLLDAVPHLPGEWYAEKSRVALRDGQYLPALHAAQLGLERDQTDPNLYYYQGEARRMFGNTMTNVIARQKMNEAAIVSFDQALKLFPQDEKLWVKKSQALDILGQHDEAKASLDMALVLDPVFAALNTYYGAHYQLLGNNQLAMQYYQKARGHVAATAGMAEILRQTKEDAGR